MNVKLVSPSDKYFRARTNGSSASFFFLSFSATLKLLLPFRLDPDWSPRDDRSESDKFKVPAISTLPMFKTTNFSFTFVHSNKTQIVRATVCPALAQYYPDGLVGVVVFLSPVSEILVSTINIVLDERSAG